MLPDSCVNISQLIGATFPEVCQFEMFKTAKVTIKDSDIGAIDRPCH